MGTEEPEDELQAEDEALPRPFGGYMLLAVLGSGGMGKVYLAARERIAGIARRCVVKTLRPGFGDDREYVTRFLDEARIVAQLHHRCICPVFDVGKTNGQYYIVMEYIAGRDLRTVLRRAKQRGVVLDRDLVLHVVGETLEALDYAHRTSDPVTGTPLALVHRDVSPQNVMIGFEGDVRLIDFGLAASTLKTERTAPNMVMGKVAYMAPEQIYGEPINARADQFAAAVMTYELLMSERFYEQRPPREVYAAAAAGHHRPKRFDDLPSDLRESIDQALSFDREKRFETCGEFRHALVRGRPRADAAAVRVLMEQLFAEDIAEEKKVVARLAASASQPIAHAPHAQILETSMPSGAAPSISGLSNSATFEDGTGDTTSAPSSKWQRSSEGTDTILRASRVTEPAMEVPPLPSRLGSRLLKVGVVACALVAALVAADVISSNRVTAEGDAGVTKPVVAVVERRATPMVEPVVEPAVEPKVAANIEPVEPIQAIEPKVKPTATTTKKKKKPAANALTGTLMKYLETTCPSLPCARPLLEHKHDWANTLPIDVVRRDLKACIARCD